LHERYLVEFAARDDREVSLLEQVAQLESIAVDPLLTRAIESRTERRERGEYAVNPGGDSNIQSVAVSADTGSVVDCYLGRGVLHAPDGSVLIPADEQHQLIEVQYRRIGERWFISDLYASGEEPCDP
jgi:hypothetical protein